MTCGETTQIISISQPSICYYFIEMEGPDACLSTNSPTQSVTSAPSNVSNNRKLEYQRGLQGGTNSPTIAPTISAEPSDSPVTAEPTGQVSFFFLYDRALSRNEIVCYYAHLNPYFSQANHPSLMRPRSHL